MTTKRNVLLAAGLLAAAVLTSTAFAHGNVVPQAVETKGLTPIKDAGVSLDGDGWAAVNPYRSSPEHDKAVEIGASAYNQNCAACHGLEAKSGGIAPTCACSMPVTPGMNGLSNGYAMARSAMAVCTCRRWPITSARKPCGRCAPTWTACTSRSDGHASVCRVAL